MERIQGYSVEVCDKATALLRSYTLLHLLHRFVDMTEAQVFKFNGMSFEADNLISGVSMVARTRYRDLEEIGQRHLAWEIMEKIDHPT